ncbi:MAG: hypothetical protein ACRD12_12300 [Acidimicrobiales bacterium]
MATAEEFGRVTTALAQHAPTADIGRITLVWRDGGHCDVTVETRTVGRVIGRGGATADAARATLAERFDDEQLRLLIVEMRPE